MSPISHRLTSNSSSLSLSLHTRRLLQVMGILLLHCLDALGSAKLLPHFVQERHFGTLPSFVFLGRLGLQLNSTWMRSKLLPQGASGSIGFSLQGELAGLLFFEKRRLHRDDTLPGLGAGHLVGDLGLSHDWPISSSLGRMQVQRL